LDYTERPCLRKILKIELPYDTAISFPGTYPKELKYPKRDTYALMFTAALFTAAEL
jgi:hypothetical protein